MDNSIPDSIHDGAEPEKVKTGLGLNQVKSRLNILFPDEHKLEINEDKETYRIKLVLNGKQKA